uniref:Uncharacterized protein n=1 Tax=Eutreptiella gymnastica TaxID=73025 RepID=A0A7S1JBC7_9EUGL|mmetsp:Transcript_81486/g.143692  ORF Transcript_81486/g.143692 Transcript_81486/m.143692 type:complete len:420 (+) Transcript_81486:88-1347(+)
MKVFNHLLPIAREDPLSTHAIVSPDADILLWALGALSRRIHWVRHDQCDNLIWFVCYSVRQVSTTAAASLLSPPESVQAAHGTNYCVQQTASLPPKPTAEAEDVRECEAQLPNVTALCTACMATVLPGVRLLDTALGALRSPDPPPAKVLSKEFFKDLKRYLKSPGTFGQGKPVQAFSAPGLSETTGRAPLSPPRPLSTCPVQDELLQLMVVVVQACNKHAKQSPCEAELQMKAQSLAKAVAEFLRTTEPGHAIHTQWTAVWESVQLGDAISEKDIQQLKAALTGHRKAIAKACKQRTAQLMGMQAVVTEPATGPAAEAPPLRRACTLAMQREHLRRIQASLDPLLSDMRQAVSADPLHPTPAKVEKQKQLRDDFDQSAAWIVGLLKELEGGLDEERSQSQSQAVDAEPLHLTPAKPDY